MIAQRIIRPPACLFIVFLSLAPVGCINAGSAPSDDNSVSRHIGFIDEGISDQLTIGPIARSHPDESGLLHVDVPIRSTTDLQIYADYRITFTDASGIALGSPGRWTTVAISPNHWQDIQATSSSPRAADFQMQLRYAK